MTLNAQEKLNAKYLGVFKTTAYELAFSYAGYFLEGGILTESQVTRMAEARLSSDMLVALVGGVQTVKNIERYYRQFEAEETNAKEVEHAVSWFHNTMKTIGAIYTAEELRGTNWSRPHWFYTLFVCVAHAQRAVAGMEDAPSPPSWPAVAKAMEE